MYYLTLTNAIWAAAGRLVTWTSYMDRVHMVTLMFLRSAEHSLIRGPVFTALGSRKV